MVKDCYSAALVASGKLSQKVTGIGASLIKEPLPLLSWFFYAVFGKVGSSLNYLMEIEILPPNPIE